jgi:RimJ/RimL family protein N-acetyltransferase
MSASSPHRSRIACGPALARVNQTWPAPSDVLELPDGRRVLLRPVERTDAPAIAALFARLSPESRARRFGYARGALRPEEAIAMADDDPRLGGGVVALSARGDGEVVALARYERGPGRADAELAVTVDDAWQGDCLGRAVVARATDRARADGVRRLWALTSAINHPALAILRALDPDHTEERSGASVVVRATLAPPEPAALSGPVGGLPRSLLHRLAWSIALSTVAGIVLVTLLLVGIGRLASGWQLIAAGAVAGMFVGLMLAGDFADPELDRTA